VLLSTLEVDKPGERYLGIPLRKIRDEIEDPGSSGGILSKIFLVLLNRLENNVNEINLLSTLVCCLPGLDSNRLVDGVALIRRLW